MSGNTLLFATTFMLGVILYESFPVGLLLQCQLCSGLPLVTFTFVTLVIKNKTPSLNLGSKNEQKQTNIMHKHPILNLYSSDIFSWKVTFLKIMDSKNGQTDLLYVFNTEGRKTHRSHPSLHSSMSRCLILPLYIHREDNANKSPRH